MPVIRPPEVCIPKALTLWKSRATRCRDGERCWPYGDPIGESVERGGERSSKWCVRVHTVSSWRGRWCIATARFWGW